MPIDARKLAVFAGLALAACATPDKPIYMGGPDNFGEANRQTMAAQIIDPAPDYDYAVPETSGEHAAQAAERYRTDKVKQPVRMSTTRSVTGSGSGGSGGGSGGGGSN